MSSGVDSLLPNTERSEDPSQDLVGLDATYQRCERVEREAKLARDQFGVVQPWRISIDMASCISKVGGSEAQGADALVKLYTAWHAAEPEADHDARIAEGNQRLEDATPLVNPATDP